MFNLILTVIAIGLLAVVAVASVNYIPWWQKPSLEAAARVQAGLVSLDRAFQAASQAGTLTGTFASPQEALQSLLVQPYLRFTPPGLPGYSWGLYKKDVTGPGDPYSGLFYLCLAPSSASTPPSEPTLTGLTRAAAIASPQQAVVASSCGATASGVGAGAPTLTYYLVAAPVASF